jgi:hypothetical protein
MKNLFDIKKENNLNFILPLEYRFSKDENIAENILIVIHLFYESRVEGYLKYIENIPSNINILFTTSNPVLQSCLEMHMKRLGKRYKIVEKCNRGRDISGLLVACRNEILKYRYICFLHDKKEKVEYLRKDLNLLVNCLWENMIGSSAYISNIIETFERNPELGVLMPPEHVSENYSMLFLNTWYLNFLNMQSLAKEMNLNCDLNADKKPISVGTVFWARVDALKKLFEKEWKYEDFAEEPLPDDGTLSHAVERCFAYVAQDAGYNTGIVMTDRFAGERMDYMQEVLTEAFGLLDGLFGISTVNRMKNRKKLYLDMLHFVSGCSKLFIYGAGKLGKQCLSILTLSSHEVNAFIETTDDKQISQYCGLPVLPISDVLLDETCGIIVAVSYKYMDEIIKKLKTEFPQFNRIFCFNYGW